MTTTTVGVIPADTFANRLMLARAQAGHLSIREAAERCGLGRGAWQNWEKGARPDGYDELVSLVAERLGVDREWLRNGGSLAHSEHPTPPARWMRSSMRVTKPSHTRVLPRRSQMAPNVRPADRRPIGRSEASTGPSSSRRPTLIR